MNEPAPEQVLPWRQYICLACGLIYDEEQGDPDSGLAPGTRFEDIPDDWECPLCGVTKADFEPFVRQSACVVEQPQRFNQEPGILIVGAGRAGWSVAEALREQGYQQAITLISACRGDVYHKPELSVAISRGADEAALIQESGADAARRLGVQLLSDTFAVGLSPALQQLRTTRGTFSYTKLVLAQGAKPSQQPQLPGSLCWRINNLGAWSGLQQVLAGGPCSIAIIGSGMIGCELAEDFARAGHRITLLDRNTAPLNGLLPDEAASRLIDSLGGLGVNYRNCVEVAAITATDSGQRAITLTDGDVLTVDHIVAATGLVTDSRLARQAGLQFDQGLAVDAQTLVTSDPNIYALGDCISIGGKPCRFIEPIKHQAQAIAHAIAGLDTLQYRHLPPVVRLKTRALPITLHGMPEAGGRWETVQRDPNQLIMEQYLGERRTSRLEVGSPARNRAA